MIRENFFKTFIYVHLKAVSTFVFVSALSGCLSLNQARSLNDRAAAHYAAFNLDVLVQAETERQRIRRARCYSPMLPPAAISAAAADPRLGGDWVEELLSDCPHFSAFVADLVLRRARDAGLLDRADRP